MVTRPSLGQRLSGAWPAANSLESHIRAEQVRIVFRQAPPAQLLNIAAAGAVCWVLWDVTPRGGLLLWVGTIATVTLLRLALGLVFSRRAPGPEAMVRWERAFVGSLAAVTLAWGLGGWLVMPADSPVHQAIVYFFLMGVAGGAVATYSAHAVAAGLAICALMLPATIGFALQEALELRLMAAGGALYIVAALRSMRGFGFFLRRTLQLSYELQQAYARVREQAHTDELTGLANRRAFVEIGTAATDQARRYHRPLALLMMDIDHFKRINDTFGHALGDAALRAAAGTLRQAARRADTAGRLGGEEFALLMPETTLEQAEVVAERIRRDVAAVTVPHGNTPIRFTCSIGVAQQTPTANDLDGLLRAADEALYQAKAEGRNRVVGNPTADRR
jgi:diguanylate cyclase